jgi:hypothetical protein
MNMNREFARVEIIYGRRRGSQWFGDGISAGFGGHEPGGKAWKQPVNWDRVAGLLTVLVVLALSWTVVGIAVSHFLR